MALSYVMLSKYASKIAGESKIKFYADKKS
ncbi:hypothetical protein DAPPPG734_11535 [Pantoea agglomerans]|uniref:Uncharacterized protein n=1 Tax=Enterobacter agglomerans TaxID=549 RepID=A0AAN2FCZ0_ENTAG|nr:hypothetical protein DAPPPG734_11535 [Pantoea agglomerans]